MALVRTKENGYGEPVLARQTGELVQDEPRAVVGGGFDGHYLPAVPIHEHVYHKTVAPELVVAIRVDYMPRAGVRVPADKKKEE